MEITGNDALTAGRSPVKRLLDAAFAPKLGAVAYLTKPFDPPALASLVAGELGRAGELKQAPATLLAALAESHPAA